MMLLIARYTLARSVLTKRYALKHALRRDWREIKLYETLVRSEYNMMVGT